MILKFSTELDSCKETLYYYGMDDVPEKQVPVQEWYTSLPPVERMRLQVQAEQRQKQYEERILPMKGFEPDSPITTQDEAIRTVVLWAHYRSIAALFSAYDYQLKNGSNPENRVKAADLMDDLRQSRECIDPIANNGDWSMMKKYWQDRITAPVEPKKTGSNITDELNRIGYKTQCLEYDRLNIPAAQKVLKLLPERTKPINPVSVDTNPLVKI